MAEQPPKTAPPPEEPFDDEQADLSRELKYLEVRIAQQEEKLEALMQQIYNERDPSRSKELRDNMKVEKGLVETARSEWEHALGIFHDKDVEWDEEVRRRIKLGNNAMLKIEDEA